MPQRLTGVRQEHTDPEGFSTDSVDGLHDDVLVKLLFLVIFVFDELSITFCLASSEFDELFFDLFVVHVLDDCRATLLKSHVHFISLFRVVFFFGNIG